eukprot:PhF_6_TR43373/c1_g1_i1/m.66512
MSGEWHGGHWVLQTATRWRNEWIATHVSQSYRREQHCDVASPVYHCVYRIGGACIDMHVCKTIFRGRSTSICDRHINQPHHHRTLRSHIRIHHQKQTEKHQSSHIAPCSVRNILSVCNQPNR